MIRVVFLIVIFVWNLWGIFRTISNWHLSVDSVEKSFENTPEDILVLINWTTAIFTMLLWSVTLILNTKIVPNKTIAMLMIILAAVEILLFIPRVLHTSELLKGTAREMAVKWVKNAKSARSVVNLLFNLVETVVMGFALYFIFTKGAVL